MKPIFTIHAGEYLIGEEIEKKFANCEIWVPVKDTGTDLLITNSINRSKQVGLQVKYSKDFLPQMKNVLNKNIIACGWWRLSKKKILTSNADFWVLAPYSFYERQVHSIIIEPKILAKKLSAIHGSKELFNVYLWITKTQRCFETRGIKKKDHKFIFDKHFDQIDKERDFSDFLNAWSKIEKRIHT